MDIGLAALALTRIPFEECLSRVDKSPFDSVLEVQRAFLRKSKTSGEKKD